MIVAKNLSLSFFNRKILEKVNLRLKKSQIIALLGPTGSGKTCLAYCLSGVIPHLIKGKLEGEVLIDGISTRNMKVNEILRKVSLVLQNPEAQLFGMTVRDDLEFPLLNRGFPQQRVEERVEELLNFFGLKDLENRPPRTLSGGQKQKLVIASALASDPEFLILDEPFSNLDPLWRRRLAEMIVGMKKEGKGILLIEKRLKPIFNELDRILVLNSGRLLWDLSPWEFLENEEAVRASGALLGWIK